MNDEQRKEIRQQFWDEDYFDGLPNRGELLKHFINEYGKAIERQQQAEIQTLKMDIHSLTYGERLAKHLNKPVAWMYNYENFPDSFVVCRARKSDQDIPLYTHPIKEQLTDEEIIKVYEDMLGVASAKGSAIDFARAILRKASKK